MTEVYIAQSIGHRSTPRLELIGTAPFPKFGSLVVAESVHRSQGRLIAETLMESLAGGTIDALLVHLLDVRRSQLVVSYNKEGLHDDIES